MKDIDKLIDINFQVEQQKEELIPLKGFKLYLFEALYLIQKFTGRYIFWEILFSIIEFIQLMAFPMDIVFDESLGNYWVNTIGNFFRYFQLIFIWRGTIFFYYYLYYCLYIYNIINVFIFICYY